MYSEVHGRDWHHKDIAEQIHGLVPAGWEAADVQVVIGLVAISFTARHIRSFPSNCTAAVHNLINYQYHQTLFVTQQSASLGPEGKIGECGVASCGGSCDLLSENA